MATILEKIEKQSNFVFVYANDEINPQRKLSVSIKDKNLNEALADLLTPLNIAFELVNDKIILKPVKPSSPLAGGSSGEEAKKKNPLLLPDPMKKSPSKAASSTPPEKDCPTSASSCPVPISARPPETTAALP
ncbi:STN domain-containing protein [Puia sp. P3]|uniref:STN domain-containing protein n=1 Tax=Puia sp. P3 TaxID=3423952 RepID=UPI003D6747B3